MQTQEIPRISILKCNFHPSCPAFLKFRSSSFKFLLSLFFFLLLIQNSFSQTAVEDTSKVKKHSGKKAALMSAVVPGSGQVYNKKYWKVPVVYAGLLATGYSITYNRSNYQKSKRAYVARIDEDSTTMDLDFSPDISNQQLLSDMEYYHKWLEMSYIVFGLVYVLNIVDASVDAHLFTFDVSDDLSFRVVPEISPALSSKNQYSGFRFTINF